ncbi:MAG TPA: hypothetical protein RMH99_30565 [Sandaracinaceae bacterium LLY-WYZ-13_1]|nr:hypothetical protein [Sandaracinaceae bacterium LLY-WYZ-13_1]
MGGYLALGQAALVAFAVVAYFIWPHVFGTHDAEQVLEGLQRAPFAYVMKLDPIVLLGTVVQLPVFVALWAALRRAAPTGALFGLVLAGISTAACLSTRPIVEIIALADLHAAASSAAQEALYVAAAEGLLAQFHGVAWAVSVMCGGAAGLVFGLSMRRSEAFSSVSVWATALSGVGALLVPVPVVGIVSLFLLGTVVGMVASISYGLDLIRARPASAAADAQTVSSPRR